MLVTVVIDPEAFDRSHFATPGYRDQAEILFRGLESNGVMLVDSRSKLLDALEDQLCMLSTKDGQQLQIRLAELKKRQGHRLIVADPSRCDTPQSMGLHQIACKVRTACVGDSVIVDRPKYEEFLSRRVPCSTFTPLSEYISSGIELERRRLMEQLPFLDQLEPGDFDALITRAVRYSKTLRFYDKQIGHGNSTGRFRAGLERILGLWVRAAHYPKETLKAEVYTCVQSTRDPEEVVHRRVVSYLTRPLYEQFGVPVRLFWKHDQCHMTHDRYLQTDNVALSFSKGFDYLDGTTFQRCKVQVDNGAGTHLNEYRSLRDARPPV